MNQNREFMNKNSHNTLYGQKWVYNVLSRFLKKEN